MKRLNKKKTDTAIRVVEHLLESDGFVIGHSLNLRIVIEAAKAYLNVPKNHTVKVIK